MQKQIEKVRRIGGIGLEIGLGIFLITMLVFAWKTPSTQAKTATLTPAKATRNAMQLPAPATLCIQDDSSGAFLTFDKNTGVYSFNSCNGFTTGGTGQVTIKGGIVTLQHTPTDRRLTATDDTVTHRGKMGFQLFNPSHFFTINDRNTLDDTCTCPATMKPVGE